MRMAFDHERLGRVPDARYVPPRLDAMMEQVRGLLDTHGALGVVALEVPALPRIEAECGAAVYDTVLASLAPQVGRLRDLERRGRIIWGMVPDVDQFVLFVAQEGEAAEGTGLEEVAEEVWTRLAAHVLRTVAPFGVPGTLNVGYSLLLPNPMVRLERAVHRALDQARLMARDRSALVTIRRRERLRRLLAEGALDTVVQPIVQLDGALVRAYEGLVRGPAGTDIESPAMLFALAGQAEATMHLDRACLEAALARIAELPVGTLLFVNAMPSLLNDRSLRRWILQAAGAMDPRRVVVEINERAAVPGYDVVADAVRHLRTGGVRIAIDDLGAGYANLEHVLRLEPEFLKLDMSLIRGIHRSGVKQAMVSSMVAVGRATGATVIAEGIEWPEEQETLTHLGVEWGQGFLFGAPRPGFGPTRRRRTVAPVTATKEVQP